MPFFCLPYLILFHLPKVILSPNTSSKYNYKHIDLSEYSSLVEEE